MNKTTLVSLALFIPSILQSGRISVGHCLFSALIYIKYANEIKQKTEWGVDAGWLRIVNDSPPSLEKKKGPD